MIQQINLYQDAFQKKQQKPVIVYILIGIGSTILVLLGLSIYLVLGLNTIKNKFETSKDQLSNIQSTLNLLQENVSKQQVNTAIIDEIDRLQNNFFSLSKAINLLTDTKSDQTQGFSRYFTALADQSNANVWLNYISIKAKTDDLTLKGSSFDPSKIPALLQRLQLEPVFQGKTFENLSITQAKKAKNRTDFTISTLIEKKKESEQKEPVQFVDYAKLIPEQI